MYKLFDKKLNIVQALIVDSLGSHVVAIHELFYDCTVLFEICIIVTPKVHFGMKTMVSILVSLFTCCTTMIMLPLINSKPTPVEDEASEG